MPILLDHLCVQSRKVKTYKIICKQCRHSWTFLPIFQDYYISGLIANSLLTTIILNAKMFTYDFIEKIGTINVKYSKKYRIGYLTYVEEFTNESEYKERLEEYLNKYRKEILSLPFQLNAQQSRKAFLNNLHDEFLLTKGMLNTKYSQVLIRSYECISNQKRNFKCYFPRYLQKKYLISARDAYRKIHVVYALHNDKIDNAIDILKTSALNDGIELKGLDVNIVERIRTTLSSPELAYLFFVLFQKVADDKNFNRSFLSRLLANNLSTKRTASPQASQLRKHFTEVNDNVKFKVEQLFIELSKNCMSEHL
jgi:hypothetical protein